MKYLRIPFLFLIVFSVFAGCQKQHNIDDLKVKVNELNEKMTNAFLEGNPESVIPMYTEDAISLPSYQPMIKGIEAIKAQVEKDKEVPMKMKSFELKSTDVLVSGDFVVDIGTYSLVVEMPDIPGGEWPDHGKYLTLFEIQKDGSLLMKADIWNTDVNPWQDMMKKEGEEK